MRDLALLRAVARGDLVVPALDAVLEPLAARAALEADVAVDGADVDVEGGGRLQQEEVDFDPHSFGGDIWHHLRDAILLGRVDNGEALAVPRVEANERGLPPSLEEIDVDGGNVAQRPAKTWVRLV